MQLGIDFGTTRTIVAYADRGNYPVVSFIDDDGDYHDFFPSVAAFDSGQLIFGFEALSFEAAGNNILRSFKRVLSSPDINTDTQVEVSNQLVPISTLLTEYAKTLADKLTNSSSISDSFNLSDSKVVLAVPAHAHSAQRFLTLDSFRKAGFNVNALLNEPSAAGFEYTHRKGNTLNSKRTRIIVYDLGGGTFDASLVSVDGTSHDVVDSLGVNRLGGDDFDLELVKCALKQSDLKLDQLSARDLTELINQARSAKEHLSPQTRRIPLQVMDRDVDVKVDDFYQAVTPLVNQTLEAMGPLVGKLDEGLELDDDVAGIYLVGGGAGLPLVPRILREHFGRRVHRSPYPAASTAIGLAIAADPNADYSLTDKLSRGFGVFRELSGGKSLSFDPIFTRQAELDPTDGVSVSRRYRAAHNVGWFRFVEYTYLNAYHEPVGDILPFGQLIFPFTSELQTNLNTDLSTVPVKRTGEGHLIEETYFIDSNGIVHVSITDLDTGFIQKASW